jgi:TolA-binding protein/biopolymer transport protein ExbD
MYPFKVKGVREIRNTEFMKVVLQVLAAVVFFPIAFTLTSAQDPADPAKADDLRKLLKEDEKSPVEAQAGDELFEYANIIYGKKFYDLAIDKFRTYYETYPGGPHAETAHFRSAECYLRLGMTSEAISTYKEVIKKYADGEFVSPAAYRLGSSAYNKQNYEEAVPYFRKAAETADRDELKVSSLFYCARSLDLSGKQEEALAVYSALAEDEKSGPILTAKALTRSAELHAANKDDTKALEALSHLPALDSLSNSKNRQQDELAKVLEKAQALQKRLSEISVTIGVSSSGAIRLEDRVLQVEELQSALGGFPFKKVIHAVIQIDPKTPTRLVAQVVTALEKAGVEAGILAVFSLRMIALDRLSGE